MTAKLKIERRIAKVPKGYYRKLLNTFAKLGGKKIENFTEDNQNSFDIFYLDSTQTSYLVCNRRYWNGRYEATTSTLMGPYLSVQQMLQDRSLPISIKSWLPYWSKIHKLLE